MRADDALERRLALLPPRVPSPHHAERVKTQCRARLESRRRRHVRSRAVAEFTCNVLAPAALGCAALVYGTAILILTLYAPGSGFQDSVPGALLSSLFGGPT